MTRFSDLRQKIAFAEIDWLLSSNAPDWVFSIYGELAIEPLLAHKSGNRTVPSGINRILEHAIVPEIMRKCSSEDINLAIHNIRLLERIYSETQLSGVGGFLVLQLNGPAPIRHTVFYSVIRSNAVTREYLPKALQHKNPLVRLAALTIYESELPKMQDELFSLFNDPDVRVCLKVIDIIRSHPEEMVPYLVYLLQNNHPCPEILASILRDIAYKIQTPLSELARSRSMPKESIDDLIALAVQNNFSDRQLIKLLGHENQKIKYFAKDALERRLASGDREFVDLAVSEAFKNSGASEFISLLLCTNENKLGQILPDLILRIFEKHEEMFTSCPPIPVLEHPVIASLLFEVISRKEAAVPVLFGLLDNENKSVQAFAISALGEIAPTSMTEEIVKRFILVGAQCKTQLISLSSHGYGSSQVDDLFSVVQRTLIKIGTPEAEDFSKIILSEDGSYARTVGLSRTQKAIQTFISVLKGEDEVTQRAAKEKLSAFYGFVFNDLASRKSIVQLGGELLDGPLRKPSGRCSFRVRRIARGVAFA